MKRVVLTRGAFDAFYRSYSTPPIPADETALMVSYNVKLKLNAASEVPTLSEHMQREAAAIGARANRQLKAESADFEFTDEEFELCKSRFAEGRKSLTGWMEIEVGEAVLAFRNARKVENGDGTVPATP